MEENPDRAFRFGLRQLLIAVGILSILFAIYNAIPRAIGDEEFRHIGAGMTMSQVRAILGEPASIQPPKKGRAEVVWGYRMKGSLFGFWWIKFTGPDGVVHHWWI